MISKNKIMLQIPVDKGIANDFKNICKSTETKAGELFEVMFSTFVQVCQARSKEKKNEERN